MAKVVDPPRNSTEHLRDVLQYLSPPLLLASFILVAAAHTIRLANAKDASDASDTTEAKGPGGKPLPATKKKKRAAADSANIRTTNPALQRLFQWASAAVTVNYVVAASSIGTHAIVDRATTGEHGWWCGEPKTVSTPPLSGGLGERAHPVLTSCTVVGLHARFEFSLGLLYPLTFRLGE